MTETQKNNRLNVELLPEPPKKNVSETGTNDKQIKNINFHGNTAMSIGELWHLS